MRPDLDTKYVEKTDVLDHGYIRVVDVLGTDLSVVNAARVSYDKESDSMTEADKRLLRFLWDNGHTSPFRHAAFSLEIYAPLFVARQWWKHVVASCHIDDQNGWNESSRRYITEEPVFYVPDQWRSNPENRKQGSGGPVDDSTSQHLSENLERITRTCMVGYESAQHAGIAPEQARLFIPAYGMYVRWRWLVSLHGLIHFVNLRSEHSAQYEIREYSDVLAAMLSEHFPETYQAVIVEHG